MNLVLDTAPLVWLLAGTGRVGQSVADLVADSSNSVFVSAASAWEMAIKVALGKLSVPADVSTWLPRELAAMPATPLPITLAHAAAVEYLPRHHRDPFDRLLIAQALLEDLALVTADRQFERYAVRVIAC